MRQRKINILLTFALRQRKINILLTFALRQRILNFNNFNRFIFQKKKFRNLLIV